MFDSNTRCHTEARISRPGNACPACDFTDIGKVDDSCAIACGETSVLRCVQRGPESMCDCGWSLRFGDAWNFQTKSPGRDGTKEATDN